MSHGPGTVASCPEEARKGDFNIVALDLDLDLSASIGEPVANVSAAVASWERRRIGVRSSEAAGGEDHGGIESPAWSDEDRSTDGLGALT